ncbi:signal peptidase I [Corynebacterium sp. zg-331]|uniref:signal peptidase I n=1 Tax=unclassified Corynebacterium TaxID=2624378 RepID=UPI0014003101|nr:signal peptidase I [Corynebacterium sp. zg-331]MPV51810.1 signal peptidase I [Corynebacterium sp. zg331]
MTDSSRASLPADGADATSAAGVEDSSQAKKEKKELPWYLEIPLIIGVTFLIVFLVQTFVGRVYMIPSGSMEPTLHGCAGCAGDRIAVEKISYYFSDPQPGDVVVFAGPPSWNQSFVSHRSDNPVVRGLQDLGSYVGLVAPNENNLVKRVIATEGQTVSCQEGDPAVMVDGRPTDQSFTLNPPQFQVTGAGGSEACGGAYFGPVTVPEGNVWVMGDNRTNSGDSRVHMGDEYQGTVPVDNIRGKTVARIWPLGRMGLVDSPDIQEGAA